MKALVFEGPHHITVQERPDPEPGPGEIALSVIATGICGSDLHGYTGENGRRFAGQVMGHETVGRVAALGADVAAPPVGSLVTVNPVIACGQCPACLAKCEQRCPTRRVIGVDPSISSAFAERMVVPARNVVILPLDLPADLGALVEPLSVGYHAARRGGVTGGSAVLVIGGGPIGQAAALGARRLGADVVVSELAPSRAELVRQLGFPVLDPAGDLAAQVERALGRLPEIVIDAVAINPTLAQALTVSGVGATIVMVGMGSPRIELAAFTISTEERTVVGSFCYGSVEFADTAQWVAEHADELSPLIDGSVDIDGAAKAFADLADGTSTASKIVVRLGAAHS